MIHLIVFSKDRPLQLHGMLSSVFANWWRGGVRVDVLVCSEPPYVDAYAAVEGEFLGRASVFHERDFSPDLNTLLMGDESYTCFGCDDVVYTRPVEAPVIERVLAEDPETLGFSLRLGHNVRRTMFGNEMPHPPFLGPRDTGLYWDIEDGVRDWGYPWEVLGTIYRTDFVREVVAALVKQERCNNPSQLEHYGNAWLEYNEHESKFRAYTYSRLVVPTVNVVQQEFPNGVVGTTTLDPPFLLDCWNHGLRLDVRRYACMTTDTWRIPDFHLRRAT